MTALLEILKSKGKIGGVGLMVIGISHMIAVYFGQLAGGYEFGASTFFLGLGVLGIRGKQDAPTA